MSDVITFKNGLKFVVLSKLTLDDERYLFLSNTEDAETIFVKFDENQNVVPVEDGKIITKLLDVVKKQIKDNQ